MFPSSPSQRGRREKKSKNSKGVLFCPRREGGGERGLPLKKIVHPPLCHPRVILLRFLSSSSLLTSRLWKTCPFLLLLLWFRPRSFLPSYVCPLLPLELFPFGGKKKTFKCPSLFSPMMHFPLFRLRFFYNSHSSCQCHLCYSSTLINLSWDAKEEEESFYPKSKRKEKACQYTLTRTGEKSRKLLSLFSHWPAWP